MFSEATAEVLPRLFKIKYESGTLEELLYVDMPREYHNSSGQIVLDYAKAIQESVFEQLRVVRDGQLRIVFSPDLKVRDRNNYLELLTELELPLFLILSFIYPTGFLVDIPLFILSFSDMLLGVLRPAP
jgi:hypothetical protein